MSRNVKIRYFLSRNVKIRYFLSRNVKIRAMSRKNGINYATSSLRIFLTIALLFGSAMVPFVNCTLATDATLGNECYQLRNTKALLAGRDADVAWLSHWPSSSYLVSSFLRVAFYLVSSFIRVALPRPSLFVETTPAGHFFWLGGWQSLRFLTFEDCWYCYNFHNNERHYHWYHHVQTPSKELEIWQKRGRGVSTCQAQRRKTPPCRPGLASKEKSQKTKLESHWQKLDNNASLSDVGYFWASQNVLIKFRYLCSYVGLLILHESLISWFKSCKKTPNFILWNLK